MIRFVPNALSGNDASIDAIAPTPPTALQGLTLQVCWALPTTAKVPNGRSTSTVAAPDESKRTQPRESGDPSRSESTAIEKPSLLTKVRLVGSLTSQRT